MGRVGTTQRATGRMIASKVTLFFWRGTWQNCQHNRSARQLLDVPAAWPCRPGLFALSFWGCQYDLAVFTLPCRPFPSTSPVSFVSLYFSFSLLAISPFLLFYSPLCYCCFLNAPATPRTSQHINPLHTIILWTPAVDTLPPDCRLPSFSSLIFFFDLSPAFISPPLALVQGSALDSTDAIDCLLDTDTSAPAFLPLVYNLSSLPECGATTAVCACRSVEAPCG